MLRIYRRPGIRYGKKIRYISPQHICTEIDIDIEYSKAIFSNLKIDEAQFVDQGNDTVKTTLRQNVITNIITDRNAVEY